jgi:hypothetical protein
MVMNQNKGTLLSALGPALRLPTARLKACEALPYFAGGVNDLVPYELPGSGRIGVSKGGVLIYDPELLAQWTALEAGAVVLHEYVHIFSRHAERFEELVRRGVAQNNEQDHEDFNVAADAEINDNLIEAGLPLPSINGSSPITPASLGMPEHLSAEQYFVDILEKRKQGKPPPKSPGCGSGAGNPQDWEPDGQLLSKLERDPVEQDITRRSAAEKIVQRGKERGDVPAGWLAQAEGEIPSSDIPWEDELVQEVFAGVAHTEGIGDYTFTVPSRFQSALIDEYGDDAPVLPGEHTPLPEVFTAIDTSGSVCDEDLRKMVGHTMGILDTLGGMSVTWIACDAQVHACTEVRSVDEMLTNLKGRGGTDFRPVFEHIKGMQKQPDVLVFQTDGGGPAPEEPPGYKTIWLITPGGQLPYLESAGGPVPYGRAIWMDPEDRKRHAADKR